MFDRYCYDQSLLDCPFCGGAARLTARRTTSGAIAFVSCSYCKAQGRTFQLQQTDQDDDFADPAFANAARAWNQRTAAGVAV